MKGTTCLIWFLVMSRVALSGTSGCEAGEKWSVGWADHRNFYLAAWYGDWKDHLAYARHMGHSHVYYRPGMELDPQANGLYFYLGSPEYHCYTRDVDTTREYSEEEKEFLSRFAALKDSTAPFPDNLATGWFKQPHLFCAEPDYQQQKVIDFIIGETLERIAAIEERGADFKFAGYMFDVPQLTGDFWDTIQTKTTGSQVTLAYWTGSDSGSRHPEVTHEYETYSEGKAAYYKQLFSRTRERYPDLKVFMEPYTIYNSYLSKIEDREDVAELMPDILAQEKAGTDFVTDERIFASGRVHRSQVMSTTPDVFTEREAREIAGLAAANGQFTGWYGRWGGSGTMPNYQDIWEVPPRLLLLKAIPTWENLLGTPLSQRSWDGESYRSPNATFNEGVTIAMQPGTGKAFVVFNDPEVSVVLPERARSDVQVYRTNGILREVGEPVSDIILSGRTIRLKDYYSAGRAYILK